MANLGICAIHGNLILCQSTHYGTEATDVFDKIFALPGDSNSADTGPASNCPRREALQAALTFQWRIFQCLELASVALLISAVVVAIFWGFVKMKRARGLREGRDESYTRKLWCEVIFLCLLVSSTALSGASALSVWQISSALEFTSTSDIFGGKIPIHAGKTLITLQGVSCVFSISLFGCVLYYQGHKKKDHAFLWTFCLDKNKNCLDKNKTPRGSLSHQAYSRRGSSPGLGSVTGGRNRDWDDDYNTNHNPLQNPIPRLNPKPPQFPNPPRDIGHDTARTATVPSEGGGKQREGPQGGPVPPLAARGGPNKSGESQSKNTTFHINFVSSFSRVSGGPHSDNLIVTPPQAKTRRESAPQSYVSRTASDWGDSKEGRRSRWGSLSPEESRSLARHAKQNIRGPRRTSTAAIKSFSTTMEVEEDDMVFEAPREAGQARTHERGPTAVAGPVRMRQSDVGGDFHMTSALAKRAPPSAETRKPNAKDLSVIRRQEGVNALTEDYNGVLSRGAAEEVFDDNPGEDSSRRPASTFCPSPLTISLMNSPLVGMSRRTSPAPSERPRSLIPSPDTTPSQSDAGQSDARQIQSRPSDATSKGVKVKEASRDDNRNDGADTTLPNSPAADATEPSDETIAKGRVFKWIKDLKETMWNGTNHQV